MTATFLPYGRQLVDDDDIDAVVAVLRSDWLTTGPAVQSFEAALSSATGAAHAVAVSSGTAGLHCAMFAIGIGPGDEVIVPSLTFAATANAVLYCGGTPVFADVDADTLLISPASVAAKITSRTRAIVAVDYAGHPADYDALRPIADAHGLRLIADACHALGGSYHGRSVGTLADLTVLSFHPVKHITTGEGGAVVSGDPSLADRARLFRNHGITTDHRQREAQGSWFYEMVELGFNYRITDIQCALGTSQLRKLSSWVRRRQALADAYRRLLDAVPGVRPLEVNAAVGHAYHLFVVRVAAEKRPEVYRALRGAGIGANVHYIPVHLHPYYQRRLGTGPGLCPVAEQAYEEILSLPMFAAMTDDDVAFVVEALRRAVV